MLKSALRVAIFSGSSSPNAQHELLAEHMARLLITSGFGIVNGGGPGLMETVARNASLAGGHVIGVHLAIEGREKSIYNNETHSYTDVRERQNKILELWDLYLALPGGLGTVYEILEVVTLKATGGIDKKTPLILLDGSYWKILDSLIDSLVREKYAKETIKDYYTIVDTPEEALALIRAYGGR